MQKLIEKDNKYYIEIKGKLEKVAIFTDHYYSLKPYNGIPLLEIDGIRMHLIRDFNTPLDYAKAVMKEINITKDDLVYDTCGGLGYLAIEESKEAKQVISTELRKEILELGKLNPYSEAYFNSKNIKIINKSCYNYIKKIKDNSINVIMHDPPTITVADELYSLEFYKECYRILNQKGKFFHYIGAVGQKHGRKLELEIISKLQLANFKKCKHIEKLQAIICEK